jgi:hypothetical protein
MKTVTDHNPQKPPVWLDHPKKGGEPFDKIVDYQEQVYSFTKKKKVGHNSFLFINSGIVVEIKGAEIVESRKFYIIYKYRNKIDLDCFTCREIWSRMYLAFSSVCQISPRQRMARYHDF